MAFFGQQGYSVGPFHYPAQPGTFDRILQIADVATNLWGLYQKHKDKKLSDVVKKLAVGRELYQDQPVPIDETLGKQIENVSGFQLPRVTEESNQQTLAELMKTGAANVTGYTNLTDPTKQEALRSSLPAVGTYAPLPAKPPTTLEAFAVRGLAKGGGSAAEQKALELYRQAHGKTDPYALELFRQRLRENQLNTVYNLANGTISQVRGPNLKVVTPWTDPKELAKFRSDLEAGQTKTVYDQKYPDVPVATMRRHDTFAPTPKEPKVDPTTIGEKTTTTIDKKLGGKETRQTTKEKYKIGQNQAQVVEIKGIGKINAQDLPPKPNQMIEYSTGKVIRIGETKFRVIPNQGEPYEVEMWAQ